MVGKASRSPSLFDVGNIFDLELPADSFFAQLGQVDLFDEADFAHLYCANNGRPSIPPTQLALLILLQYHERCSDGEAVERSAYDLRWAVALRRPAGRRLCGRSTLVEFRARLALHDAVDTLFDRILARAREQGLLPSRPLRVLIDTRQVVGRGAVEDTYNLLARAMDLVIAALARVAEQPKLTWAAAHDLELFVRRREASFKGQAEVDWDDAADRRRFFREVVGEARRLLTVAHEQLPGLDPAAQAEVGAQVALLEQILRQDVVELPARPTPPPAPGGKAEAGEAADSSPEQEATPEPAAVPEPAAAAAAPDVGETANAPTPAAEVPEASAEPVLRQGTAKDRMPSATDPDQRHGHKSHSRKFTGHKSRIAVDAESGLILAAGVLAGNAPDAQDVLAQVREVDERCGPVAEVVGDSAFAAGAVRASFEAAGLALRARQPQAAAPAWGISKAAFRVLFTEREATGVVCPAGRVATEYEQQRDGTRIFSFAPWCQRCPLRHQCVQARTLRQGRKVHVHPQEWLLQAAREYQETEAGWETLRSRVGVEHAFARLARLGMGQARYFGRAKTRVQVLLTCAAVNLRRLLRWEAAQTAAAGMGA